MIRPGQSPETVFGENNNLPFAGVGKWLITGTEMNIDTEFNVGDSVCYLSGDNIIHTSISKIIIEISYADDSFLMVYKLSDGLSVPRNNYPQWGKRLFRDKDSLMRYLSES